MKENEAEQTPVEGQVEQAGVVDLSAPEAGEELKTESEPVQVVDAEVVEEEPEPQVDELTLLGEQLTEAQAKASEYLDGWQRARAELANYRRREAQRRKQMDVEVKSRLLSNLLPVLDDLGRAFEMIPEGVQDSPWAEGLSLVGQKLETVLEKSGLSVVPVEPGDAFDPQFHEAVTHEPSTDCKEGCIIQVVQRGYDLNGTVLRPALVRVSCGTTD